MTLSAQRNNIQFVCFIITIMMMVLLCSIATYTYTRFCWRQSSILNSVANCISSNIPFQVVSDVSYASRLSFCCFNPLAIILPSFFCAIVFLLCCTSSYALIVCTSYCFSVFALFILTSFSLLTCFALTLFSASFTAVISEVFGRLLGVAFSACNKYRRDSHDLALQFRVAWLEPFGCIDRSNGSHIISPCVP